jgi:hypothetical protein
VVHYLSSRIGGALAFAATERHLCWCCGVWGGGGGGGGGAPPPPGVVGAVRADPDSVKLTKMVSQGTFGSLYQV